MTPCQFCSRPHDEPDDDCEWDWDGIRKKERAARIKAAGLPKCRRCTNPMWFDQPGMHHTCKKESTT
jgi:hypothetical protein